MEEGKEDEVRKVIWFPDYLVELTSPLPPPQFELDMMPFSHDRQTDRQTDRQKGGDNFGEKMK